MLVVKMKMHFERGPEALHAWVQILQSALAGVAIIIEDGRVTPLPKSFL